MHTQRAALAAPPPARDDPTIWRVGDALWAGRQPLLVVDKPRKKPGRNRNDDRPILDGLIWRSRGGAQWKAWPREQSGPRSTAHDRRQEWVEHGCLERAWARLLAGYDGERGPQWVWLAADGCIGVAHNWFNRFRRLLARWEELPRLRPTRRHPHQLPQAPPRPLTLRIGCKSAKTGRGERPQRRGDAENDAETRETNSGAGAIVAPALC